MEDQHTKVASAPRFAKSLVEGSARVARTFRRCLAFDEFEVAAITTCLVFPFPVAMEGVDVNTVKVKLWPDLAIYDGVVLLVPLPHVGEAAAVLTEHQVLHFIKVWPLLAANYSKTPVPLARKMAHFASVRAKG